MDNNQTPDPWQSPQTHDPQPEREPRRNDDFRLPNFNSTLDVAQQLWRDHRPTLFSAWGIFAAVWLLSSLVTGVGGIALGMDPVSQQEMMQNMPAGEANPFGIYGALGPAFWAFLGVSMIIGFVQIGVGIASFAPVRRAWRDGRDLSFNEVAGAMGGRIIPGALLYIVATIGTAIGTVLCVIPGVFVAYFMLPTFYLVGGRGDGVFDSLTTGFEWGKRHVAVLIALIVISIVTLVGLGCIAGFASQAMLSMGTAGYIINQLFTWFFGSILGFFIWLYYLGTMLTIEQAEEQSVGW